MPSEFEYKQLATIVYAASSQNRIDIPTGWSLLDWQPDRWSGFSAGIFRNNLTKEIVISYTGTNDTADKLNWSAGMGLPVPQIFNAMAYYFDFRKSHPEATNITFTGHSLGGGLASLMAVYFDKQATVFDEAPFQPAALSPLVLPLLGPTMAASGYWDASLATFIASGGSLALSRESNVTQYYVEGEVLSTIRFSSNTLVGTDISISLGNSTADMIDRHSMSLMTALDASDSFLQAARRLPNSVTELLDPDLFAADSRSEIKNDLLRRLLRHQLGVKDVIQKDGMLDRFAADMNLIAQDGGLTMTDSNINKALIEFAMQMYYENAIATEADKMLFSEAPGGIQFDRTDVADTLGQARGYSLYFAEHFNLSAFTHEEISLITSILPTLLDWTIQAGASGLSVTDTGNRGAFMLGGDSGDDLTGGSGNDLLIGNEGGDTINGDEGDDVLFGNTGFDIIDGGGGDDTLVGGEEDDSLNGGDGYDRYLYKLGDGIDRIEDSDGGTIQINGSGTKYALGGIFFKQEDGETWIGQTSNHTITIQHDGDWTLTSDDSATVMLANGTDPVDFNMKLVDEQQTQITPDRTIVGDLAPKDFDPSTDGIQTQTDDLGNVITDPGKAEPGRMDEFEDSEGSDDISGLGGNDWINAWRGGDDKLDGGADDDIVMGLAGDDTVIGGDGMDILRGDQGGDKLYAGEELTLADALAQQDAAPSGQKGDFIDGGMDDDSLVGDIGNDALNGGLGDDIILGGAGDDDMNGDMVSYSITRDWSIQRSIIEDGDTSYYTSTYLNAPFVLPTEGGDDVLYGGAGDDWVSSGYGNDYIDGGENDDVLFGEGDNDDLFGGAGDDLLNGDSVDTAIDKQGDDYLDGEAGDDTVLGSGGADILYGGDGNDFLQGDGGTGTGDGDDYLDGEAGNDTLLGEGGGDMLFGDVGNDTLGGGDGDDTISGGDDNDTLFGQDGNDTLDGDAGADQISGSTGEDMLSGGEGDDLLLGDAGNDALMGDTGFDQLQGGDGDDALYGDDGSDILFGEAGNDALMGGAGNDHLLGGHGDDILDGGAGDDVYYISAYEGNDHIVDSGGTDWLVVQDAFWGDLKLGVGSLKLTVKSTGQEIHLDDFDPDNPLAASGIEYFQFADGTVKSRNQLIQALGFTPTGTPGDDALSGTALNDTFTALAGNDTISALAGNDTVYLDAGDDYADAGDGDDSVWGGDGDDMVSGGNGADRIDGGAGKDVLYGEAGADRLAGGLGDDILAGGAGSDTLEGGEGNDLYLFGPGDGQDVAIDGSGIDSVQLTGGLTEAQVTFQRLGGDLIVALRNATDKLTLKDWFSPAGNFQSLVLGDGTVLDRAAVEDRLARNQAPVALEDPVAVGEDGVTQASGNALANDADPEGRALRVTNPGAYSGNYGALTLNSAGAFAYALNNHSAAVQALAAGQTATERFDYAVTDDDPNGAANASSAIVVSIAGVNDAPIAGADQAFVVEDEVISASGNVLANDRDVDAGTVLQVASPGTIVSAYGTVTLDSDGAYAYALDNASTALQSLGRDRQVTERFDYSVSDGIASIAATLDVTVRGTNDAPVVASALSDQTASANSAFSWKLPENSFVDPDYGDVLVYRATLADGSALPAWLAFDAATQTFSGRVPKDAAGSLDIRVTAADGVDVGGEGGSLSVSDVFSLSFATGGGKPVDKNHGNEGVGNGVDAPPPGHAYSFNDGAGTSPGNPGAHGGNGYRPSTGPDRADIHAAVPASKLVGSLTQAHGNGTNSNNGLHVGSSRSDTPAPEAPAGVDGATSNGLATDNGGASAMGKVKSSPDAWLEPFYLDPAKVDEAPWQAHSAPGGGEESALARWAVMDERLATHLAGADGAATGNGPGCLTGWMDAGCFLGSTTPGANDPLSLRAGGGHALKTLKGLDEGFRQAA